MISGDIPFIEVFEWKKGAPRPGTHRKPRHDMIESLQIPPDGQIPQVGDVLGLALSSTDRQGQPILDLGEGRAIYPFRVIGREFMWSVVSKDDEPTDFSKMWIYVRQLPEEEYEHQP